MFEHWNNTVLIISSIAAVIVALGVIWGWTTRNVTRPLRRLAATLHDHWDYLNDQLANGDHTGTLRQQVNRIDERQQVVRQRQDQHAVAIASLQAQVRQVAATTKRTEVTVGDTAAALEVVHEAVSNPTGEIPIVAERWPRL